MCEGLNTLLNEALAKQGMLFEKENRIKMQEQ